MTDKVEVSDEDGRVRITDVGIFDKMTEEEVLAVFEEDESNTPAIDGLVDKFTKGGPGSGRKGHKTARKENRGSRKMTDHEKVGTKLISKETGRTAIITGKGAGGYKLTIHYPNKDLKDQLLPVQLISNWKAQKSKDESEFKSTLSTSILNKFIPDIKSINKTPAIDALITKGGPGSGVKGHTTAKELAIKKKFGELDKARNKADALAEKDIRDGQRMIDKAAKESEAAFEEMLKLGSEGTKAQFKKTSEKRDKLKKQEQAGWDLRIKGQNRKAEISDKYQAEAMKLMNLPKEPIRTSRKKTPKEDTSPIAPDIKQRKITKGEPKPLGKMNREEALEHLRKKKEEGIRRKEEHLQSKSTSHEDSMIKVENTIKEIFPKYPLDYSGDLVTVSTLGNGDTLLSAYVPTSDRGTDPNIGEPSKKEFSSYEDKWKPSMARLQNALRIKGFRDMKVTLDYGEKGHIGLRVSGTLEKVKPLEDKPKGGKEQPTLTQDAPKHTPKSNLLATKHAEAAVKRGTLFKELGKKSKKELKGMIQQDSKMDMAGSLKQMTKSDMKYHITSSKYPSPKGSEEAYNALTKQERKGLLKPIPDPKTPKAKGSEPPKRRNAPSIKAIQVEGVDAYQSTHGKKPRGTGLWMFQIGEDSGNTYSAETSFKEAQKQAKKQAQKEMKWSVKLLP